MYEADKTGEMVPNEDDRLLTEITTRAEQILGPLQITGDYEEVYVVSPSLTYELPSALVDEAWRQRPAIQVEGEEMDSTAPVSQGQAELVVSKKMYSSQGRSFFANHIELHIKPQDSTGEPVSVYQLVTWRERGSPSPIAEATFYEDQDPLDSAPEWSSVHQDEPTSEQIKAFDRFLSAAAQQKPIKQVEMKHLVN